MVFQTQRPFLMLGELPLPIFLHHCGHVCTDNKKATPSMKVVNSKVCPHLWNALSRHKWGWHSNEGGSISREEVYGFHTSTSRGLLWYNYEPITSVYVLNSKQVGGFCFHMPRYVDLAFKGVDKSPAFKFGENDVPQDENVQRRLNDTNLF